jgi:CDP-paratose 2-epimerase
VYNIGGGDENRRSVLEVVNQIGELSGRKPGYELAGSRDDDAKYYVSDIEKARRDLGWEPKIDFDRGLRELVAWAESVR